MTHLSNEERIEKLEQTQAELLKHVKSIDDSLNRYKGFIGAIWFVVSCMGTFLGAIRFFHKG